jgi:SAF domain
MCVKFRLPDRGLPFGLRCRYVGLVLWLDRPPYLRWMAASALVVVALAFEISGPDVVRYPFVLRTVATGESVQPDDLAWRDVPVGLLPAASDVVGPAARSLRVGDPFIGGSVTSGSAIPEGWWVVAAPIPGSAPPGATVRLVAVDDGFAVDGIVTATGVDTGFGDVSIGSVAVPETAAVRISLAVSSDRLVVLVAP